MSFANRIAQYFDTGRSSDELLPARTAPADTAVPAGPAATGPEANGTATRLQDEGTPDLTDYEVPDRFTARFLTHITAEPLRDAEILARYERMDFRADGPPPRECEVCGREFRDWELEGTDREELPPDPDEAWACEECARKICGEVWPHLRHARNTHLGWQRRLVLWDLTKDHPANVVYLCFQDGDDGDDSMLLQCEAVEHRGGMRFLVRLLEGGTSDQGRRCGDEFLAEWDRRSYAALNGRPLLTPVGHTASPERRRRLKKVRRQEAQHRRELARRLKKARRQRRGR